jgi:hypothetical protein
MKTVIFRQGDVLIRSIQKLPSGKLIKRANGMLALGEVTGHSHVVEDLNIAEVFEINGQPGLYLRVGAEGVRIVHEEHRPLAIPAGDYQVEIQREYSPAAIRTVAD